MPPVVELPPDLIPRIRLGDEAAFELLFRAVYEPLVAFGTTFTGDRARAQELVQDLFLELWVRRADWRVSGSVRGYLFTAMRNRALNVRRRDTVEDDWSADEALDEVRELHPDPVSPDRALDDAELRARVAAALAALPDRCRVVMHLRWLDRLPHAEIAASLGISVKGVEIQLSRGMKALRERLRDP
jgi:RNA polymerase sigma-70 factor (ECF subfamily)